MKRILFLLVVFGTILLTAEDFSGWFCLDNCFEAGASLMIDAREPLQGNICRSPLFKVEPGADYILTFLTENELTAGEIDLELKGYSNYDGTEESIRKMKLLSTIAGAPMKGGQCKGKRTWRCAFTAPSDVTAFQARLIGKGAQGRLVLKDWSLGPGDTTLPLPFLKELPPLDGTLHPEFAEQALCLPDFLVFPENEGMALEKEPTEAYLAASQTHIMAVFILHRGEGQQWVQHDYARDTSNIWRDDSIELYFTHVGGSRPIYDFMVNLNGNIFDSMNENIGWDSGIQAKGAYLDDSTGIIQMLIPLNDVGYVPYVDDRVVDPYWRVNVRRNHPKSEVRFTEYQSSAAPLRDRYDLSHYLAVRRVENAPQTAYSPMLHTEAGLALRERKDRFSRPAQPLYEELFTDKKPPLSGEGGIFWYAPFDPSNFIWAMQHGKRWSQKMFGEIFKEHRFHTFCMYDVMVDWLDVAKQKPAGAMLCVPFFAKNDAGEGWTFPHSPSARRNMLNQLKEYIEKRPGQIWGVCLGDEILYRMAVPILQRANDPNRRENDPEIKEMIRCVTEEFGCGKFGPPTNVDAREPYNFLAFHKYIISQFQLATREIRAMLDEHEKKTGEKIYIMAHDPTGYSPNENLSRLAGICDLVTLQTGPSENPERQAIGYTSQLLHDISRLPVWPCIHLESYLGYYSPEEVCLGMSEAARGGATGVHFFDADTRGGLAKSGSTRICYYGNKPRWDAILEYMDRFDSMPALKIPEGSFGVFFSTDTELSQRTYDMIAYEMIYNTAGAGAGARFTFFDDDQIEDGAVDLQKWPLIVVPDAPLERSLVPKALQSYVEKGGTLLCFDPRAFSNDINADDTSALREALFGAASRPRKPGNAGITLVKDESVFGDLQLDRLPVFDSALYLEPAEGTRVLGRFADGTAAITCKDYPNGGRAILFSFHLGTLVNLPTIKPWSQFFHAFLSKMNLPVDLDIWRFCFPMPKDLGTKPPMPQMKCLTGNNFFWHDNTPQRLGNVTLPGATYTLSRPADSDAEGKTTFAFGQGNLTNRLAALNAPDIYNGENRPLIDQGKLKMSMFADRWNSSEPVSVRFDFGREVTVKQVKLYFSGTLPAFTVSCDGGKTTLSCDGVETAPFTDAWWELFEKPNVRPGEALFTCFAEVGEKVVDLPAPQKTKELILNLGACPEDQRMMLSEIEIWGE